MARPKFWRSVSVSAMLFSRGQVGVYRMAPWSSQSLRNPSHRVVALSAFQQECDVPISGGSYLPAQCLSAGARWGCAEWLHGAHNPGAILVIEVVVFGCFWLFPVVPVVPGCSWLFLVVPGCSRLFLVVPGCFWLFLVVSGCSWLFLVAPGCYWLFPVVPGCSHLFLVASGCLWLFMHITHKHRHKRCNRAWSSQSCYNPGQ